MAGNGKKVLLHVCCGPCSIMCIQSLRDEGYDVTGYFANPNIHPVSEYFRRREAMEQVAEQMDHPCCGRTMCMICPAGSRWCTIWVSRTIKGMPAAATATRAVLP
ncbi:MAG: epoxyqueuosine reductase QueH [Bilophila wadsworthia]